MVPTEELKGFDFDGMRGRSQRIRFYDKKGSTQGIRMLTQQPCYSRESLYYHLNLGDDIFLDLILNL